jgi:hypothetical protein
MNVDIANVISNAKTPYSIKAWYLLARTTAEIILFATIFFLVRMELRRDYKNLIVFDHLLEIILRIFNAVKKLH